MNPELEQAESGLMGNLQMAQECLTLAYIAETGASLADIQVISHPILGGGFAIHLERKLV